MTRHLIVGAGASYAECKAAKLSDDLCLPLVSNFARKMWTDYNPAPFLHAYFEANGISVPLGKSARAIFFDLESSRPSEFNIELFFEFAWNERTKFPGEWESLTNHGILVPMMLSLSRGLWRTGIIETPLQLSPKVAGRLNAADVVLDLNYDTLFEVGATQAGKEITFLPNLPPPGALWIAKPHGSINMVVNIERRSFAFGNLDWPGNPQPADGSRNFAGFVPPRFNKKFSDHPAAVMILKPLSDLKPSIVTFWGVGFTRSDLDLAELYAEWCDVAQTIEVINPDEQVSKNLRAKFGDKVRHFGEIESWLAK